jgi:hypothetical protein
MPNETARTLPEEAIAFLKAGDRIRAVEAIRARWDCDLWTAFDAMRGWQPPDADAVATQADDQRFPD